MPHRSWQYVAALMLAALAGGLLLPATAGAGVRSVLQAALLPVTAPVRVAGAWLRAPGGGDGRSAGELARENSELRRELDRYAAQIDMLAELRSERNRLGRRLREMSEPVQVQVAAAGAGELMLSTTPGGRLREGAAVWHDGALVGRVRQVGPLGARVRRITDRGQVLNVRFGTRDADGGFAFRPGDPVAVAGTGGGLRVGQLRAPDGVVPVKVGDLALLADRADWPMELQGAQIGQVVAVRQRPDAPQVVEVDLEPAAIPRPLEVMVVVR